jgi:hypothetical protein
VEGWVMLVVVKSASGALLGETDNVDMMIRKKEA